jgi:hypothetical protein
MGIMTNAFLQQVDAFVKQHQIPVVQFRKGQRKDDVAAEYRANFRGSEGVLFLGKAQEKVNVFRTEKRTSENAKKYPWIVKSSVPVNQFYFYCIDEDFGPFFLKFCTYFPYNAKLCINGHEYVKRQLAKEGIAFEPLDNQRNLPINFQLVSSACLTSAASTATSFLLPGRIYNTRHGNSPVDYRPGAFDISSGRNRLCPFRSRSLLLLGPF